MKTFCISLPETNERFLRAKNHFEEIGLNVEFIHGINWKSSGLMTSNTYDFDNPGDGYRIPAKQVGLFLSHYIAWSIIVHQENDPVMVLEDDALFSEGAKEIIQQALYALTEKQIEYDMLFVGSGNTFDKEKTQVLGNIWEVKYPQTTHAYIIKKEAARRLLYEQRKVYAPIDLALIHDSFPKMKILTLLPRVVSQYGQEIAA